MALQSDYQYDRIYETSPRSMTIEEINDSYVRPVESALGYKSSFKTEVVKHERTQRNDH